MSRGKMHLRSGCLLISKDTDVTVILALAKCLNVTGVLHILGEHVIDIDEVPQGMSHRGMTSQTLAGVYVLAGCEYTPGTYGGSHEWYLRAALKYKNVLADMDEATSEQSTNACVETLTLLAYLERHGKTEVLNMMEEDHQFDALHNSSSDVEDAKRRCRHMFVSNSNLGTTEWGLHVRQFISDVAKSTSELIPPREHIELQRRRVCLMPQTTGKMLNAKIYRPRMLVGLMKTMDLIARDGFYWSAKKT
ncbi:unnamed protein product [Agarophyton chilense]